MQAVIEDLEAKLASTTAGNSSSLFEELNVLMEAKLEVEAKLEAAVGEIQEVRDSFSEKEKDYSEQLVSVCTELVYLLTITA
jgi:predicted  nucleic acid-binding Zn-ribbon protein